MLSILSHSLLSIVLSNPTIFSERIEVQVGSQIITTSEIQNQVRNLKESSNNIAESELLKMARENLIDDRLLRGSLSKAGIAVSDQDVERRLNQIRLGQGIDSLEDFTKLLQAQGMSLSDLRRQIKNQMELEQFQGLIQSQVSQTVDEAEARAYYVNNPSEFDSQIELDIQECLIPFTVNRAEVEALARRFQARPKEFDRCVQEYSQSPTREFNGLLTNVRRGKFMPQVEDLIFSTKENEVVEMEMPNAIRLFKTVSRRDLGPRDFKEVRQEIEAKIRANRMQQASERYFQQLRRETPIVIRSSSSEG